MAALLSYEDKDVFLKAIKPKKNKSKEFVFYNLLLANEDEILGNLELPVPFFLQEDVLLTSAASASYRSGSAKKESFNASAKVILKAIDEFSCLVKLTESTAIIGQENPLDLIDDSFVYKVGEITDFSWKVYLDDYKSAMNEWRKASLGVNVLTHGDFAFSNMFLSHDGNKVFCLILSLFAFRHLPLI